MKKEKPYNPMKRVRKKIPPAEFDFKDKKRYSRKEKHKIKLGG